MAPTRRIISVSRRTDIPAFYGRWFLRRIDEGFAGVVNPFGGKRYLVSLRPEDATCLVFWSKDFTPFVEPLETLDRLGYKFYFNYTITAAPAIFESHVDKAAALRTLQHLSRRYSPKRIHWRFDPIVISNLSDGAFYRRQFEALARELEGVVERCFFSFVMRYKKVERNFAELESASDVRTADGDSSFKADLIGRLADIAGAHGITLYSCCGDGLINDRVRKAHCIDGALIEQLFFPQGLIHKEKPTRDGCGCTESVDIGTYDTCPHGCVYCYANANKAVARRAFENHDPDSAFLGYSRQRSDPWVAEIRQAQAQAGSIWPHATQD
jgi:hypothetical protein